MNWQIKKFSELSSYEIYEMLKSRSEVFVVEQNCPFQDCDDKDKNSYHLFLEENESIVAYLRILPKGLSFDEISIGRVLVKKEHRNKGLAREMMLNAISFIENELNENSIRISAQSYLLDFYKSLGFKVVSDLYYEDNIPHVEMVYINKKDK